MSGDGNTHLHFEHIPHPHVTARKAQGPIKVADQHKSANAMQRFNTRAALLITSIVGSMWCAYVFAIFDLISLPAAIRGGSATIVSWVAQTFLQLVLLSVIMVGQKVSAAASDKQALQTYKDAEALLKIQDEVHRLLKLNNDLTAQIHEATCTASAPAAAKAARSSPPAKPRGRG